jgi:multicomponent Na+:H+ antiporter subunit C
MPAALIYALAGIWICCIGLRGLLVEADALRRVLAANVMGSGIFLLLVAMARRSPAPEPDPVPHAMVLTGIVVAVSATALLLTLLGRLRDDGEDSP